MVRDIHARTLQAQADAVLKGIHARPNGGGIDLRLPGDWQRAYSNPSRLYSYTIFDAAGNAVIWSPNLDRPLAAIPIESSRSVAPIQFVGVGRDQQAALAMRDAQGWTAVVARGDLSRDALADSLFAEDSEQVLILLPFALLALAVIWVVSGWSLRPIAQASEKAALVGPANPDMRVSAEGLPREIQPLVDAVNGALDRLSRAYATEQRLTADAAHELRTPLAVLNLRLQRARSSGKIDWAAIELELGQMSRLVTQLLDLARKETFTRQARDADLPVINLSRIVREAAAMMVAVAEVQERRLDVDLPDVTPMRGRIDDLRDMMRNLLENALIHGRGAVNVTLRQSTHGGKPHWTVEVCDEGEGVGAAQAELVFDRFRKLNPASPGSGLGLAIVRQVVQNHGGQVRFVAGRGCVVVVLPASDQPRVPSQQDAHAIQASSTSPATVILDDGHVPRSDGIACQPDIPSPWRANDLDEPAHPKTRSYPQHNTHR
ncbi:MAG TPA: HAMP domain-containing sensor histidine kinase [Gemmataceae bacterium]|nr:HAMP domain-containing sensor histidine kinase [Gemmataceae bacterium]